VAPGRATIISVPRLKFWSRIMPHKHNLFFPRLFESQGRKILEISVLAENVPGRIAEISKLLAERGVNILWGVHHASKDPSAAWWCFFVDGEGVEEADLRRLISGVEGVRDVVVSRANLGDMVVDVHHGIQLLGPDAVVEMRAGWLRTIFREAYKRWGDDGRRMVEFLGTYGGRRSYSEWRRRFGLEGRELAEAALSVMVVLGWIERGEIVELDPERASARVKAWNSFESGEPSDVPICHFLRGVLVGFFSEMFGEACFGREVACMAKGDPYCEFVISKKPFIFPAEGAWGREASEEAGG